MPDFNEREFVRQVRKIIEAILAHDEAAVREGLRLLERTQRDIIAEMAGQGRSEFDMAVLRQVLKAIEQRIEEFRRQLENHLRVSLSRSIEFGEQLADAPIKMTTSPVIGVSRNVAITAANFSVEYVTGLTEAMRSQITNIVRRAALGGLSVKDAVDQVGTSLTKPGRFKSIAARAEAIIRTEVLRIQAIAAHAKMLANRESMRRAGYDLKKQWVTAKDNRVRLSHSLTNGQIREVDEPFDVGLLIGADALLVEQLQYPRDPAGSARNTVRCRCISKPVVSRLAA